MNNHSDRSGKAAPRWRPASATETGDEIDRRLAIGFLTDLTSAVLEAARVRVGDSVGASAPNTTGGTLIKPGGGACYPAFWIRDFAMSLDCGLIPLEEQRHALLLTASRQQEQDEKLPSGSRIPAGAIADHINFDGTPIFFPGTYDPLKQGRPFGYLPSLDDHYYFVHMAWQYVRQSGDHGILDLAVNGMPLRRRLERAFHVPPVNAETGLVECDDDSRGVNFGFFDTVVHTGALLFCSLLRWQAATELADLIGDPRYTDEARRIQRHLIAVFGRPDGLLRAATGKSGQADVWGSAFAVASGALEDESADAMASRLADAHRQGTLAWRGNIRHVPVDGDFSTTSAWEATDCPFSAYQNGAYWGTPTGWVCQAIARVEEPLARRLADDYLDELAQGDFRRGEDCGSPWECLSLDGHRRNAVYLTSVTCPLAAFQRLNRGV